MIKTQIKQKKEHTRERSPDKDHTTGIGGVRKYGGSAANTLERFLYKVFPALAEIDALNTGQQQKNLDGIRRRNIKNLPLVINAFLYFIVCLGYTVNKFKLFNKRHRYRMFFPFYLKLKPAGEFSILKEINICEEDTQIVSCSLYGDKEKYISACLDNARNFKNVFPGWKMRVYCHYKIESKVIRELVEHDCQVVIVKEEIAKKADGTYTIQGMFWRFLPLAENVICSIQDIDDQWNEEHYALLQHWFQKANTPFYRMLLPNPLPWPKSHITGKNWGAAGAPIPDIKTKIINHKNRLKFGDDELFLRKVVFPEAMKSGLSTYLYKETTSIWNICPNRKLYRAKENCYEYVF